MDEKSRQTVIGNRLNHSIFSYIDCHTLSGHPDQPAFWKQAFTPLINEFSSGIIYETYLTTEKNQFGTFTLEQLFKTLKKEGKQFVLILDEFSVLMSHPGLNNAEFYGGLRSLTSRCEGFATIIGSSRSVTFLNKETQRINPHGSPYFNIFTEVKIGPLPRVHAQYVLNQAGTVFDNRDKNFLLMVSGSHPYLLQLSAQVLWDLNVQGKQDGRYQIASDEIYDQASPHFEETWKSLSDDEKNNYHGNRINSNT